jgi:hypothetical protein
VYTFGKADGGYILGLNAAPHDDSRRGSARARQLAPLVDGVFWRSLDCDSYIHVLNVDSER